MSSTVLSYSARSQNGRGGGAVHSRVIDRELPSVGGFALYIEVHVKYARSIIPGSPPLFSRAHPKTKAIRIFFFFFFIGIFALPVNCFKPVGKIVWCTYQMQMHWVCRGCVGVCMGAYMCASVHVCLSSHPYRGLCSFRSHAFLILFSNLFLVLYTHKCTEIDFMIRSLISSSFFFSSCIHLTCNQVCR